MTFNQKLGMALSYLGMSQADLARAMGVSPQNLNSKLKNGKYNQEDIERFGKALQAEITINIKLKDGTVI